MKRLLDELIGHVRAIEVAGVDVVHSGGDRLAQNSGSTWDIAWRSPNEFAAVLAGKLHGSTVAHAVQRNGGVGKAECTFQVLMDLSFFSLKICRCRMSIPSAKVR